MASGSMSGPKDEPNCSLARALLQVGERWSLLIIREAVMGSKRFDEFHYRLGIARNILQDRLTTLVEAGVLSREFAEGNARIPFYALTQKGWDLFPVIAALMQWGDRWLDGGKGPPILLLDPTDRTPIPHLAIKGHDGNLVDPKRITLRAGPGATERTLRRLS